MITSRAGTGAELAGSQEITTIGALGDNTLPHMKFDALSFGSVCSGPEEIRRSARTFIA